MLVFSTLVLYRGIKEILIYSMSLPPYAIWFGTTVLERLASPTRQHQYFSYLPIEARICKQRKINVESVICHAENFGGRGDANIIIYSIVRFRKYRNKKYRGHTITGRRNDGCGKYTHDTITKATTTVSTYSRINISQTGGDFIFYFYILIDKIHPTKTIINKPRRRRRRSNSTLLIMMIYKWYNVTVIWPSYRSVTTNHQSWKQGFRRGGGTKNTIDLWPAVQGRNGKL